MLFTRTFQILGCDTRVELNMFSHNCSSCGIIGGSVWIEKDRKRSLYACLHMPDAFYDEVHDAQPLKLQPSFLNMFIHVHFKIIEFNTKVELSMFFTFVLVVA